MKRTFVIAAVAVILVGAAAFGLYRWLSPSPTTLTLPGIVEIQEVRLGSKVGGRVAKLHVMEGDMVEPGQALVTFEVPELEKQYLQQKAKVAQLEQEWKKAEYGPRQEEIAMARSDMASAQADYKQAQEDYDRAVRLYSEKSASRADLDMAKGTRDRTLGKLSTTKSNLEMLEAGTRIEDKLGAKAKYEEAQGKLEELEVNLREQTIYAPEKAIIEVISVRRGDLVPPNQPVIRVLRAADMWIKIYVPETKLSMIKNGVMVDVHIDAYPETTFKGKVVQVGTISEFTPRNVQSVDERRYQVFPVKVQVQDPRDYFRAGLSAEVAVPLEGPAVTALTIDARGVTIRFGNFTAVNRASLKVSPGEVFGLLGPNGSGKTTLIRGLCGLVPFAEGTATVLDRDVTKDAETVRNHIGYMSQKFSLYEDLTANENMDFYSGIYGLTPAKARQRQAELVKLTGLHPYLTRRAGRLSGGWKQRLALVCALLHEPRLLFLDEPTAGIDPVARRDLWNLLFRLSAEGISLVVTTHYMDEAERCGRVGYIYLSNMLAMGTPAELKKLPQVTPEGTRWLQILGVNAPALLQRLQDRSGVLQATIFGQAVHALVDTRFAPDDLGLKAEQIEVTEPSLEDVFVALSRAAAEKEES